MSGNEGVVSRYVLERYQHVLGQNLADQVPGDAPWIRICRGPSIGVCQCPGCVGVRLPDALFDLIPKQSIVS